MHRKVLLLAGEESGMLYAERLGALLRAAGCEVRGYGDYGFHTADLAVMGFWPVLRRIFYFIGVARTMKRAICGWRPDAVVTVDYPGLNLKLAAFAKKRGIPAVHIVCPQVWAWHRNRIPKVASALSELLCFFPFEPSLFDGTGLKVKFIGHPLVRVVELENADGAAAMSGKAGRDRIVALLPGSRIGEIGRILPRLLGAVAILSRRHAEDARAKGRGEPAFRVVIPAANRGAEMEIRRILGEASDLPPVEVRLGGARQLLREAHCAAVASGTATLEAALARCPTVLVYAVSPILAWFARRVITGVRHVGLANIIAEKCGFEPPMPELLQEDFTSDAVADRLEAWLDSAEARADAAARLDSAMEHLRADGTPLEIAAHEILAALPPSQ